MKIKTVIPPYIGLIWRHDSYVISQPGFSPNKNPNWPIIVAFLIKFPSLINYLEYIACLYLNTSVTAQVEVKLSGMCDAAVNSRAWRDIPTLATLKKGR